ncbi:FecR family protein [Corticibacter populi]|nr:FecR domain-containing protein [Corticibacter populi]
MTPPPAQGKQRDAVPGVEDLAEALRQRFPSKDELLAEARAQTEAQARRHRQLKRAAGGMLSVAALAALWWADPVLQRQELSAALGAQVRHTMDDGSAIVLNTDSALTLEQRLRTRSLVLQRGEAAFTVAPGWRPFIVRSGDIRVRDIGTAFTVRQIKGDTRVVVLEGMVEVSPWPGAGQLAQAGTVSLHAGQGLLAGSSVPGSYAMERVDALAAGAWRQGRLVFNGTRLDEVAAEVQRYRGGAVHIEGGDVAQLRVSGVYDIDRIEALLDALPQALPVQVSRRADGGVTIAAARSRPATSDRRLKKNR